MSKSAELADLIRSSAGSVAPEYGLILGSGLGHLSGVVLMFFAPPIGECLQFSKSLICSFHVNLHLLYSRVRVRLPSLDAVQRLRDLRLSIGDYGLELDITGLYCMLCRKCLFRGLLCIM